MPCSSDIRALRIRRFFVLTAILLAVTAFTGGAQAAGQRTGTLHARLLSVRPGVQPHPGNSGISIYVSPSGNDSNPGTYSSPIRTLYHARNVVRSLNRKMASNIIVYFEGGSYRLVHPLTLSARDSGNNGHNVVWTSVPRQTAVISGADRITGWRLSDPSKTVWSAPVPSNLLTRQLYVNGMRAQLTSGRMPVNLAQTATGYVASTPVMASWRNPSDIEFVYMAQLGQMSEPICPVASIHGTIITMAQPCWDNSTRRQLNPISPWYDGNLVGYGFLTTPTYVENAYELLDQPGQFYLDQTAHRIYYIPRPGEDMDTADVEAPDMQTLVQGSGSANAPIHNITFSNLQFSYATWMQPSTPAGFSEIQANFTLTGSRAYSTQGLCHLVPHGTCPYGDWTKEPGSVQFSYDQNLMFQNDSFVHLGAAGLNLDDGSQHDMVEGSVFTDISGNGLEIGNVDMPNATGSSQALGMQVIDNHLYGLPVEYHGGDAIMVGYAADSTISHNQIDHVAYTGISMGWGGWLDKINQPPLPNFSHDNVVSDNLIYDYMQTFSDGGGIYTQGVTGWSLAHGELVTGNVIYGQLAWSYALHSDDGATNITYSYNALYDNTYDWCCNHVNHNRKDGSYDAQAVTNNYWQQGDPDSFTRNVREARNTVITGGKQVPDWLSRNAGLQPSFKSILSWRSSGESVPSPPTRVGAFYAFDGQAYVSWRPSVASGNDPVLFYTVTSCPISVTETQATCNEPGAQSSQISAADYSRLGYAVVSGLTGGLGYRFIVTATSEDGPGTPSVPSVVAIVSTKPPAIPSQPKGVNGQAARDSVILRWHPPASDGCKGPEWNGACANPVLAYVVAGSNGKKYTVTGLSQLIISNGGGKVVAAISGLTPNRPYRFSVAAVTPTGVGPAVNVGPIKPRS